MRSYRDKYYIILIDDNDDYVIDVFANVKEMLCFFKNRNYNNIHSSLSKIFKGIYNELKFNGKIYKVEFLEKEIIEEQ